MLNFSQFPHGRWHSKPCSSLCDGICLDYDVRPKACEGSPFFDYGEEAFEIYGPNRFPVPWCSFRHLVLDYFGKEYAILPRATDCIQAYSRDGTLGNFERFAIKWFKGNIILWDEK